MSRKEVEYSFAIGAALSSSFRSAVTGAKREFTGIAKRIQELEETDTNKIGSQFIRQKEHIKNLGKELTTAKGKLKLLQNQSKEAGKHTKIFELQVQEAANEVGRLSYAFEKNAAAYQKNIAQIRNAQGSVRTLAAEYAKLSTEMEKNKSVQNRFEALQAKRDSLKSNRSSIQAEMVQTAVPMLALSVPVNQAIKFEASMADVAKTMDGMRDDDGNLTAKYYAMEQAVKNMARQIPLSYEEIASLFAAAGQQGLTELSDIQEFVTMSAQMATAFGMSQEQAADAIGGYRVSLGISFEETRSMLDLMNQFANTSSATEQDIAEVVRRIGSLGGQAGMAVKPMTALSATLVSMKVPPEQAATGIKNFLLAMTSGNAATKQQSIAFRKLGFDTVKLAKAMQEDAPNAVLSLLNSLKKLPKHEQLSTMQTLFGKESLNVISPLLSQLDLVTRNLEICADETQYAGAMAKEAGVRWQSTAGQLQTLKNKTNEVAINLGSALLPAINDTIAGVSPLITNFAEFAKENPEVVKNIVGTAGALLGLKMTTLAARYAINGLRTVWTVGKIAGTAFSFAVKTQTYSLVRQKAFMLASAAATKASTAAQWAGRNAAYAFSLVTSKQTYSLAAQKAAMLAASTATKAGTAAQWLLNAALTANPIGIIIVGLGAAAAAMYALYQTCEPVRKAFDWVFSGIASFVKEIWDGIVMLWNGLKSLGQAVGLIDEDKDIDLTVNKNLSEKLSPAADAVANPFSVFPASAAAEDFISQPEYRQNFSNAQDMQISVPMTFNVQGLDQNEFRRQMEHARPDIEEIVRKVMEKIEHQKARINFAN